METFGVSLCCDRLRWAQDPGKLEVILIHGGVREHISLFYLAILSSSELQHIVNRLHIDDIYLMNQEEDNFQAMVDAEYGPLGVPHETDRTLDKHDG